MLNVFIGYDKNEIVAYHTAVQSIIENTDQPVSFTPIAIKHLEKAYKRVRNPHQSTEFSMTRFLVPWLCNYEGTAIFMDCDIIARADIGLLYGFVCAYPEKAVHVVKHDYIPKTDFKFLDQMQSKYEKKNWSSVMVFNNKLCRALTPEYINNSSGLELHQFKWLNNDDQIGELHPSWNHLVGEYEYDKEAKLAHFTLGTPCFSKWDNQDYADEWFKVMGRMISATDSCYHTIKNEMYKDPALCGGTEDL